MSEIWNNVENDHDNDGIVNSQDSEFIALTRSIHSYISNGDFDRVPTFNGIATSFNTSDLPDEAEITEGSYKFLNSLPEFTIDDNLSKDYIININLVKSIAQLLDKNGLVNANTVNESLISFHQNKELPTSTTFYENNSSTSSIFVTGNLFTDIYSLATEMAQIAIYDITNLNRAISPTQEFDQRFIDEKIANSFGIAVACAWSGFDYDSYVSFVNNTHNQNVIVEGEIACYKIKIEEYDNEQYIELVETLKGLPELYIQDPTN